MDQKSRQPNILFIFTDQQSLRAMGARYNGCALPPAYPTIGRMVRTERFKYIVFSHGLRPELLFDLKTDPGKTRNLAANPEFAGEQQRHRRLLMEWQAATKDTWRVDADGSQQER